LFLQLRAWTTEICEIANRTNKQKKRRFKRKENIIFGE